MTFTVQTDAGLSGATAYCDVAFIDDHLGLSGATDDWDAKSVDEKKALAEFSSRYLDNSFTWNGTPILDYPDLMFPQTCSRDRAGRTIVGVPQVLKEAVAELCLFFSSNDPFADSETAGIKELQLDVMNIVFADSNTETFIKVPTQILAKLAFLGSSNLGRRRSTRVTAI